jgi:NAD dependent epimerase/dehydratase family enzyme
VKVIIAGRSGSLGRRVEPTRALAEASHQLTSPLRHWIEASTTAIWSDAGETKCDEDTPVPAGPPQMTGVAQPWEAAFDGANTAHGVILRTSIVLDRDSPRCAGSSG